MNLTELINPTPQKRRKLKVILTESQTKRLLKKVESEKSNNQNAEESKTSKG